MWCNNIYTSAHAFESQKKKKNTKKAISRTLSEEDLIELASDIFQEKKDEIDNWFLKQNISFLLSYIYDLRLIYTTRL